MTKTFLISAFCVALHFVGAGMTTENIVFEKVFQDGTSVKGVLERIDLNVQRQLKFPPDDN